MLQYCMFLSNDRSSILIFFFSTLLTQELKLNGTIFRSTSNVVEVMATLITEAPLLETLILFLILVVEEIIVVRDVVQERLLKMKTKSDKKSTSMVAWKGKSISYLVNIIYTNKFQ